MFHKQREFLERMVAQGTWPHAVLFVGPSGVERDALLWWFVGQVLGIDDPQHSADVITIGEENVRTDSGRTRLLSVERVREAIDRLSLAAYGQVKVAVIMEAHLLSSAAQNALLKTLEEPSGNSLLVLCANDVQSLLPTLLSRVMTVSLHEGIHKVEAGNFAADVAFEMFLAGGVAERFLLVQRVVKHEEGVAFVERWLEGLIMILHEGLPARWQMLDAALTARKRLDDNGNPALLLESVAFSDV